MVEQFNGKITRQFHLDLNCTNRGIIVELQDGRLIGIRNCNIPIGEGVIVIKKDGVFHVEQRGLK